MDELAITFLTAERFRARPQVGLVIHQDWHSLARGLAWPHVASRKDAYGAWCPAALEGGRVKGGRGPVSLLVADVDDCHEGALDREAEALRNYAGVIVPTFSATRARPKNRIVLLPSRALAPDEFSIAWGKLARTLAVAGITVDRGCKNINRLYYACVTRSPDAWLGARVLTGEPIDVDAMLAAARAELAEQEEERRTRERERPIASTGRYIAAAIARARESVATAPEGGRHEALVREAYSLARLGLSASDIESALLETFVARAGEARRREGVRAIRDSVAARGTAA